MSLLIMDIKTDMSKIRFSLVGIDTWFIRDRDLGRVWDWDWDLGSEISEKSPEISENIARDRDFPYIISEKLPRFGRDWYFSCIAAWISTRWLYFYRENGGKNGRDLGIRDQTVIPVSIYVTEMAMSALYKIWQPWHPSWGRSSGIVVTINLNVLLT